MDTNTPPVDKPELLLVDKPAGISSFGVVAKIRHQLSDQAGLISIKDKDGIIHQKRRKIKVGHAGTLDPFATGLLILLIGKGTKRAGEFLKLDKEYLATIRLGATSTTGDLEGDITPTPSYTSLNIPNSPNSAQTEHCSVPTRETVQKVVENFLGQTEQRVPNFSAVKINGERAYKLARAGKKVEMPVRPITIYEIEILNYTWPNLTIRCQVSSGTYIRALGEDIGQALGTGGYLTALRRTQIGKYHIEDAAALDKLLSQPI